MPKSTTKLIVHAASAAIAALAAFGCGGSPDTTTTKPEPTKEEKVWPPEFDDPQLAAGRAIFVENCARCHETGREDAPILGRQDLWAERIAKGEDELVQRAISGFETPLGDEMPPRGGNEDLPDADVRLAVKYIIKVSQ